jgi:uncharacterized membrane protein
VKRLIALYPARWRQRYGAEMARLLDDLAPFSSGTRLRVAADLIRGALGAHLSKEFRMTSVPARAIRRGAVIAAIAWVPWATGIVLTNVVFPTRQDHDGLWVPIGYLFIFAALALAGLTRASGRGRVTAGAAAGAIFGLLTIATFALVDNLFLQIVSQQQAKVEGLRESGMTSMRAYINSGLVPAGVVMTLEFAVLGIVLAAAAGAVYDLRRPRAQGLS